MRKWDSTIRRFIKSPFDEPLGGGGGPFGGGSGIPPWAVNANMWKDFTGDRARGTLPDPADTHTQVYAPNAAGVYVPFAANVLTRTDLGVQTVPTRTNLCVQSNDTSSAEWGTTSVSKTTGQADLFGGAGAALITADGASASHLVSASNVTPISYTNGTTYAISRFVKAGTTSLVQITGNTAAFGGSQYANFSLSGAGSVTASSGLVASGITAYAGGWYQVWIAVTASATTTAAGGVAVFITSGSDGRIPTNTAATTFYVSQADVTVGTFPVPPIFTTAASATVNGNQQVISGLGTKLAVGVAGVIQWQQIAPAVSGYPARVIEFNDGTGANFAALRDSAGGLLQTNITAATVDQGSVSGAAGTFAAGLITVAFSFGTNFNKFRIVGGADTTADTSVTWPALTQLAIGGRGFDTSRNNYQFTKKLALDFLTPSDNPATKFTEWYDKAVLAAAA